MTTALAILVVLALVAALVRYVRNDHFAGPANRVAERDELGRTSPPRLAV